MFGLYDKPVMNETGSLIVDDKITLGMNFTLESFLVNKNTFLDMKRIIGYTGLERNMK